MVLFEGGLSHTDFATYCSMWLSSLEMVNEAIILR